MPQGRIRRDAPEVPLNPPDVEPEEKPRQLAGEEPRLDQDAVLDATQIDGLGSIDSTEIYEGELEAGVDDDLPTGAESLEDLTTRELRAGETSSPDVAAEEGETYVAPFDPPVVADRGDPEGARIAAGFGTSALDEPYDADHHTTSLPEDDEVSARVREALVADSRTSRLADRIDVETAGGTVVLRGTVDDLDDGDLLAEVASAVRGVTDVRDQTDIRA